VNTGEDNLGCGIRCIVTVDRQTYDINFERTRVNVDNTVADLGYITMVSQQHGVSFPNTCPIDLVSASALVIELGAALEVEI
jgi:hypothetical protein